MTILLLGANGQVGRELRSALSSQGKVAALARPDIDFAVPESLRAIIRHHRPAIIVNAVAYTAVDKAESDVERAFAVNATAPGVLAEEAEALGALFVHYSTDYVFDGSKNTPYIETDLASPISIYGRSKRDGELAARSCKKHLIFRTSWVVSAHGQNFLKTMLRLAKEKDTLRVVSDQHGAPTSAALLADVTARVISSMKEEGADDARWGLYHLVAAGETSWHGLARYVVARAEEMGFPLKATPNAVVPIPTAEYPTAAKRPANSRLDTTKLRSTFNLQLPDWTQGVNGALDRLVVAA